MPLLGLVPPASGGVWHEEQTFEHDGLTRYYRYYVPDTLGPAPPVVFVLHGGGGSMREVLRNGAPAEWPEIADEEGILLVVPNGVDPDTHDPAGDNQQWNDCRADAVVRASDADDVGFIAKLVDWAIAEYGADPERIYATGASNGGMMSYRLAFELGDRIAAVAAFIANLPAVDECLRPVHPIPVFICNGDAEDNYMPWEGGCVVAKQGCERGTVISAEATRDFWLHFLRLPGEPADVFDFPDLDPDDGSTVTRELYTGGLHGAEVAFYRVRGGGHTTPSIEHRRDPRVLKLLGLGSQNHDIEGAREAWDFLSRQRLRPQPPGPGPRESAWLHVDREDEASLRLRWSEDCGAGDRYEIYRGDLLGGYATLRPEPGLCAVAGYVAAVPLGAGDADFFVVVPATDAGEGSYGAASSGPRPPALETCAASLGVEACPPSP